MRFSTKVQIVFTIGIDEPDEETAKKDVFELSKKIRESFINEYGTDKVKVSARIKKLSV